MTYGEVMDELRAFVPPQTRGRYRAEGMGWSRWRQRSQLMPKVRVQMEAMAVGHPWLEVQREKDRDQVAVEKVSEG